MTHYTGKENRFIDAVISNGGDKLAAYRSAGYSQNMSATNQSIQADKLYNKPKINLKIKELQKEAEEKAKERYRISFEERLKRVEHVYHCSIETKPDGSYQSLTSANKAIEIMNSMLGDTDEDKVGDPLNINITVSEPKSDIKVTSGA